MPEEIEVETDHLQETIDELHKEREEREKEVKDNAWTRYISLTTAFLAVIAAVAALQAGSLANASLSAKNDSIVAQAKASDQWSYYQSAGIKGNSAKQTAAILEALPGHQPNAVKSWTAEAAKYEAKKKKGEIDAKKFEEEQIKQTEKAEALLEHHEIFALCVTCTQVAIALSAIAALTKRRAVWYVSMLAGSIGLILFLNGYLHKVAPAGSAHSESSAEKPVEAAGGKKPATEP